jgi:hypothetical protein
MKNVFFLILLLSSTTFLYGQDIPAGLPILEEFIRRQQLLNGLPQNDSFTLRQATGNIFLERQDSLETKPSQFEFSVLPLIAISRHNSTRPYGWGGYGMIPNRGMQQYMSGGIYSKLGFLHIRFQPEWVGAQNKPFQGFSDSFPASVQLDRFHFWNYDDSPERFGDGAYTRFWWGQSSITARFGAFEIGAASRSVWWGPGQWNSLTFSNNAEGFPHLTLNTIKPAKTLIGNFEGQVLIGRLENSGLAPSQHAHINDLYFTPFTGDWRYLNAFIVTYNPKWVPGLFVGIARTFQQYNESRVNRFGDYLPIFEAFQKQNFFEDGHTVEFDRDGRDQQAKIFLRYTHTPANSEIYVEYGRRDHAYNWKEFLINPDHARAYLLGFKKLFPMPKKDLFLQVRGEVTHQQESVSRYIRYPGLGGEASWHTHYQARGFGNFGQHLGVGVGTGSNVQTLEVAFVEKFSKWGILLERLANHQDFYYRAFGQQRERRPWVDLSLGLLLDHQWNNLLVSSKLQFIHGMNYQWQLGENSTPDFPSGDHKFSLMGQVSLVYLLNHRIK